MTEFGFGFVAGILVALMFIATKKILDEIYDEGEKDD